MGKQYFQILEDRRRTEQQEAMARQREARLAAPAIQKPAKEFKTEMPKTTMTRWKEDVQRCIADIGKRVFTLQELYDYMDELENLHPAALVDAKAAVRHTLQKLRDDGEVVFDAPGQYIDLLFETRELTTI